MQPFYPDSYMAIEITDHCNLKCPFCPQSWLDKVHNIERGFINPALFKKIIDDCIRDRLRFGLFMPFWLGEPLLHPEFRQLMGYYFEKKEISNCWQLDTNATLLTPEVTEFILTKNANFPSRIHFSLDAYSEDMHKKLRPGGDFKKIVENIRAFVKRKAELCLDYPEVVMQFIVMRENFHEANPFQDYWNSYFKETGSGGRIFFKRFDYEIDPMVTVVTDRLYNYIIKHIHKPNEVSFKQFKERAEYDQPTDICAAPWKTVLINQNGDVTVCCKDNGMVLKVGNAGEEPISKIWWNNPKLHDFRTKLLTKPYEDLEYCSRCTMPNSPNWLKITKEEIDEFQRLPVPD
ncbi:MAG: radical SAM protein [archaeon]